MKIKTVLSKLALGAALSVSAITLATAATNNQQSFNPKQVKEIQKIIRDYIIQNPQILVKASEELQKQAAEKRKSVALQAVATYKKQLFNNPKTPTAGNPKGSVMLVEFFDYQCGHCKSMNGTVQSLIKKNKNLKVIFKELPIFGANSQFAAKMALASMKQGKYYPFHDALLAAKDPLTRQKVLNIARKVSLNVNKLEKDMKSPAIQKQLRENFVLAQALKLQGTPYFIISNKAHTKIIPVPGAAPQSYMQKQIDAVQQ